MNKKIRSLLQYVVFFGLGLFLAWWSVRDLNMAQMKLVLQHARYWLIIPVFFILIMSHVVRALRWKLLIASLNYHPKTSNSVFAVLIGYLTNQAVPRLGEIMKCTMLSRYEKIPFDKLIGTIILERIIDAITLLIIFGITLTIQPDVYSDLISTFFHSQRDPGKHKISGWLVLLIVAGIIALLLVIWMLIKKKKPADIPGLFKRIGRSVWQGVSAIRHLKKRALFVFYTLMLWSLYWGGGYLGFYALRETQQYGVKEAFSILSAGSVGMIATPGGIGAYPLLIEKTLEIYGLPGSIAGAFGWILWLAQTGVIIIGGVISFAALPYFNKQKNTLETS
jgi:uncharacterized protein (TIRG00374 family)